MGGFYTIMKKTSERGDRRDKTGSALAGRLPVLFDDGLFQPSTDSFLLGSFPLLRKGLRVCDLGAGTGLLGLLLLAREASLHVTNVELQGAAVELSRRNTELNGLEERVVNLQGDLREAAQLPAAGRFDLVVSNPPYFDAGRGAVAREKSRSVARSDATCTLPQLCDAAGRLLRYDGSFCVVFRTERMAELFACLRERGLEPKRLRMVQNTARSAPKLLLLDARKGGKAGLTVLPPLLLRDEDGGETPELAQIYFRDKE